MNFVVVPVSEDEAQRWLRGEIEDGDLLAAWRDGPAGSVLFIQNVVGRASWRPFRAVVAHLVDCGAVAGVFRSTHPAVDRVAGLLGAAPGHSDDGQRRLWVEAGKIGAWLRRGRLQGTAVFAG